jgi:nicotinamidase/pyrazinamidase
MIKRALLLIDIQNDFMPGGALAVPEGDKIVDFVNTMIITSYGFGTEVVATMDWHHADHGSFASQHGVAPFTMGELGGKPQMMWTDHCVQGTKGAELHADLITPKTTVYKGMDKTVDSYSGFFDNNKQNDTGLNNFLKEREITDLFIMGLATEYCVKFTALDAAALGYDVTVSLNGCRGLNPTDIDNAIKEMRDVGIKILGY